MKVTVLIGTMTGTAQLVAQELELTYADDDTTIEAKVMDGLGPDVFAGGGTFLVCTSTYGQGDVPDNARPLFEALSAARPDLSNVRYGVIALGDRTYADTFCFGGKKWDALLAELGAKRVGDVLLHDASAGTMPEEVATEWTAGWLALARQADDVPA